MPFCALFGSLPPCMCVLVEVLGRGSSGCWSVVWSGGVFVAATARSAIFQSIHSIGMTLRRCTSAMSKSVMARAIENDI